MLERGVPSNIGLIILRYWHIYIGVSLRNPRERGYAGAGGLIAWRHGQTALGGGARKTLKP
jgi:hypothetical protein